MSNKKGIRHNQFNRNEYDLVEEAYLNGHYWDAENQRPSLDAGGRPWTDRRVSDNINAFDNFDFVVTKYNVAGVRKKLGLINKRQPARRPPPFKPFQLLAGQASELRLEPTQPTYVVSVDDILRSVHAEVMRATEKHAPMNSAHEGHSVIREELDELWDHVKADTGHTPEAREEAIQLAAMAVRYVLDVCWG